MSGVVQLGLNYATNEVKAISVNANGELEMTAEIDSSGLATSANQTNGTQKCQVLGNTEPDGSGDSKHIHTDGNGNLLTIVSNSVNVLPADTLNGHITDDPANSIAVALTGRQTIGTATSQTFLKCNASGELLTSGGGGGGDASAANQTTMINSLSTIEGDTTSLDAKITACNTGAVVISSNSDTTKATSTLQTAGNASLSNIDTATSSIQSNVSTSANQSTMITHLSEIEGAVETVEACVTSNELAVSRKDADHGNLTKNSVVTSSTNQTTAILDTAGYKSIIVIGRTDTTSSSMNLEFSDASDFAGGTDVIYNNDDTNIGLFTPVIFQSAFSADTALSYNQAYARVTIPQRYMRIRVFNTSGSNRDYTFFYQLSN